ncbi:MAG: DUF3987 domain-containing protein [Rhodospirillales bacterium]|nr:DUF3987 domain-containing protein [Rhodospirillales bacterium]
MRRRPTPEDEDESDEIVDPLVAMVRSDARSAYYDPRYARPTSASPPGGWGEIDPAFLDEARPPVPAFPLDVLPPFWRDWVGDTAGALGAPVDYVAQSVLAAVSGLCGAGASVRIGPRWAEPLVLWQALVGAPSSGKSPAMASVRALLATLDAEQAARAGDRGKADDESPPGTLIEETALAAVADAVAANRCGVVLWRDDGAEWLLGAPETARRQWLKAWSAHPLSLSSRRSVERFAASLLLALPTERLATLLTTGNELAARFLFAWPAPAAHCPLGAAKPARDDEALAALRRIAQKARTADDPLEIAVDQRGLKAFDGFLADLANELRESALHETEGLETAWLGKGRGTVARLAGLLELLAWSELGSAGPRGQLGTEQIERGVRLWSDYFRPHAFALFHRAAPTERERQARRVVRWLRQCGLGEVSREQVRVEALHRSVNASDAEQVLYRLRDAGIVSRIDYELPSRGGRPPNRWCVSPRLATTVAAGNAGNAGNLSGQR